MTRKEATFPFTSILLHLKMTFEGGQVLKIMKQYEEVMFYGTDTAKLYALQDNQQMLPELRSRRIYVCNSI
jgi:hypothetical protein